jgi:hypothetical protein
MSVPYADLAPWLNQPMTMAWHRLKYVHAVEQNSAMMTHLSVMIFSGSAGSPQDTLGGHQKVRPVIGGPKHNS